MSEELKECPWCNAKDWRKRPSEGSRVYWLNHKPECYMSTLPEFSVHEDDVIFWNTRAQSAEVERLRKAAEEVLDVWFAPTGSDECLANLRRPIGLRDPLKLVGGADKARMDSESDKQLLRLENESQVCSL